MLASGTAVEFNGISTLRFTPLFTSLAIKPVPMRKPSAPISVGTGLVRP
jgi:hypothetical protein